MSRYRYVRNVYAQSDEGPPVHHPHLVRDTEDGSVWSHVSSGAHPDIDGSAACLKPTGRAGGGERHVSLRDVQPRV